MNTFKIALLSLAAACAVATATTADARRGFHGGARVGVFIGAPLFPYYYPRYYYPPYYPSYYPSYPYYPAPVVAPASPPVYIEQGVPGASAPSAPAPAQGGAGYWYYCRDTQTYYPYVQQCASPWQQVVPQSGPAAESAPPGSPQAGPPGPPEPADPERAPST